MLRKVVLFLVIITLTVSTGFSQYHLDVENGKLVSQDTRQTVKIVEANSPENRLVWLDRTELNDLDAAGVNTLYASLHGDENNYANIGPWKDFYNPSLGFDEQRIADWRSYFEYWISLGDGTNPQQRKYLHLLLSEQETHFRLTSEQHEAFLVRMTTAFKDLPVIWDREEYPRSQTGLLIQWNARLRELDPNNIIAIHNEPRQEPWEDLKGHNLDLVSMQAPFNEVGWRMKNAFDYGGGQWAVHASEIMPFNDGFQPNEGELALSWYLQAADVSSGAGFYYGLADQSFPNQFPYIPMYQTITQPDYKTVLENRNEMFWIESAKIDTFNRPLFPDTLLLQASEDETFGFFESRFWMRPLPKGYYFVKTKNQGEGSVARIRFFPKDFSRVDVVVLNQIPAESHIVYYSDGITPWKIAFDILEFNSDGSGFVALDNFIEFRFIGEEI